MHGFISMIYLNYLILISNYQQIQRIMVLAVFAYVSTAVLIVVVAIRNSFDVFTVGFHTVAETQASHALFTFNSVFQTSFELQDLSKIGCRYTLTIFLAIIYFIVQLYATFCWVYTYFLFLCWALMFRELFTSLFDKMKSSHPETTLQVNTLTLFYCWTQDRSVKIFLHDK